MENIHKIKENIYITSDEEIKEGDWYYDTKDLESLVPIYQRSQDLKFYSGCKKIILTTDVDLIANGVQTIQEEMKQKTLEEAAERHSNETLRDNSHVSFIAGAKWQQERSYSVEDLNKHVIEFLEWREKYFAMYHGNKNRGLYYANRAYGNPYYNEDRHTALTRKYYNLHELLELFNKFKNK